MRSLLSAVVASSLAATLLGQSCFDGQAQGDIPRRSFQLPQFAEGYIEPHATAGFVFPADVLFTGLDPLIHPAADQAKTELLQEIESIRLGDPPCLPESHITEVKLNVETPGVTIGPNIDESYELKLEDTVVTITAATDYGARHAIVTLHNLLELRACNLHPKFANTALGSGGGYFFLPFERFEIYDSPRLQHRGLMLDTSRGYVPVETFKRILLTMSRVKMNVFHWHATDDQSFPLVMSASAETIHGPGGVSCHESNENPCLGAYSNVKTYSEGQIKDIVDYATSHGIRVIMEVDMPSHARSWGSANAELLSCFDLDHQRDDICLEPPCGPLSLDKAYDKVLTLAKLIIDDLDRLMTKGEYIHVGMDEVQAGCWGEDERDRLMMEYLKDILAYAASKGRRLIAWQDAFDPHGEYPQPPAVLEQQMIPQVWSEAEKGSELLERGHDLIWSNYVNLYLDCGRGNSAVATSKSWCDPFKTWWDVFAESPDLLFAEHKDQVLGGEVCLWAEQANELNTESLLWPRAAAWGAATWEPRSHVPLSTNNPSDVLDPQEHLRRFSYAMFRHCVPFTPMQTMWCYYGDQVGEEGADGRVFCDAYAKQYLPQSTATTTLPTVTTGATATSPTSATGTIESASTTAAPPVAPPGDSGAMGNTVGITSVVILLSIVTMMW